MQQTLKVKLSQLPKIQANDPLLLYNGIPEHCVVVQTMASQTQAGEKVDYLYVIPELNDSIYISHVISS